MLGSDFVIRRHDSVVVVVVVAVVVVVVVIWGITLLWCSGLVVRTRTSYRIYHSPIFTLDHH